MKQTPMQSSVWGAPPRAAPPARERPRPSSPREPEPGEVPAFMDAELTPAEFARLGDFIEARYGIRMPDNKKVMLEHRLRKRLRALGLTSFGPYCQRVLGGDEEELVHMVDEVTTNTTDFFREPQHFDYLANVVVPTLVAERRPRLPGELRVWSAACSTGEEPYTLAMVLSEIAEKIPGFRWRVRATDICTDVLERAIRATYAAPRVEPVPMHLRQKYLLRKADGSPVVRIVPQLRDRVHFQHKNLLDRDFDAIGPVDVIFCRNVFIYFERDVQQAILQRFHRALVPGGYLFLGHSETANGRDVRLTPVTPTVYRKDLEVES